MTTRYNSREAYTANVQMWTGQDDHGALENGMLNWTIRDIIKYKVNLQRKSKLQESKVTHETINKI